MVLQSRYFGIPIPGENLLSYLFGNGGGYSTDSVWIDAQDDGKSLSLDSALVWIRRLALGLDRAGVKPGEIVMVISPNHILVPAAFLGIAAGGRIFSGANPASTVDCKLEIHYLASKD